MLGYWKSNYKEAIHCKDVLGFLLGNYSNDTNDCENHN